MSLLSELVAGFCIAAIKILLLRSIAASRQSPTVPVKGIPGYMSGLFHGGTHRSKLVRQVFRCLEIFVCIGGARLPNVLNGLAKPGPGPNC